MAREDRQVRRVQSMAVASNYKQGRQRVGPDRSGSRPFLALARAVPDGPAYWSGSAIDPSAKSLRWVAIDRLRDHRRRRRTRAPWIFFVAMIAGAELGFDAPHFAVHLRVFSDIFLRLIKTIVLLPIFAMLVTVESPAIADLRRPHGHQVRWFTSEDPYNARAGHRPRCHQLDESRRQVPANRSRRKQQRSRELHQPIGTSSCSTSFRRTSRSPLRKARFCRSRSSRFYSASRWPVLARHGALPF